MHMLFEVYITDASAPILTLQFSHASHVLALALRVDGVACI
jgi:hypothetical protein